MDNSFALRMGLLLVGVAILALVYFFGSRRSRNRRRLRAQSRVSRINPVDVISAQQTAEQKSPLFPPAEDLEFDRLKEPAIETESPFVERQDALAELPRLENEPKRRRRASPMRGKKDLTQIEMSFDDDLSDEAEHRDEQTEHLLTLYVMPPTEHAFMGESIVQGLNSVGLSYGEMDIFHHFGAGRLRTDKPLFSVANMLEPGTFDIQNIDHFSTPGLVFFLQLPAELDGAVSFELFLNTAQRLTEALGGELYADPRTPLDSVQIEDMRKIAAQY